jgi:hypothetical protein
MLITFLYLPDPHSGTRNDNNNKIKIKNILKTWISNFFLSAEEDKLIGFGSGLALRLGFGQVRYLRLLVCILNKIFDLQSPAVVARLSAPTPAA